MPMHLPKGRRRIMAIVGAAAVGAVAVGAFGVFPALATGPTASNDNNTTTPVKHVVVIFGENVSFDHYFGTYPYAANTDGTLFTPAANTPGLAGVSATVNTEWAAGLIPNTATIANATNPATSATPNPNSAQPSRLSFGQALTTSQGHNYTPEQNALDSNGTAASMDKFVENTQSSTTATSNGTSATKGYTYSSPSIVMGYYDGNTATAEWNYAQNYAMSDNSWDTTFGPSTPGALNLISGQTYGSTAYTVDSTKLGTNFGLSAALTAVSTDPGSVDSINSTTNVGTTMGDGDPAYDDCSAGTVIGLSGQNVGDLLNAKNISWGWFQGGFAPSKAATGIAGAQCNTATAGLDGEVTAYSAHHNPFEYYASTANPHHLAPASPAEIGHSGQANHQYDISYFSDALNGTGGATLPAVSYLKAPRAQDGHPGNSDPIDEQKFIVDEVNAIESSKYWSNTAIVLAYDDSDGWYDHVAPTILNASHDTTETTTYNSKTVPVDAAVCDQATVGGSAVTELGSEANRCGPSQRLPLLVISPYAKTNYVSHDLTDQVSVLQFIEDNWSTAKVGGNSFDALSATDNFSDLLNFTSPQQRNVILNGDGSVQSVNSVAVKSNSTLALTASATKQTYGKSTVTLHAIASGDAGTPAGSVTFYDGSKSLGSKTLSGGTASLALPATLPVGANSITATLTPSSVTVSPSTSSAVHVTVAKATSTSKVAFSKNRVSVAVTASTPVTVTGKAKVYDGSKLIKTVSLSKGKASFADKLKKGTHKLKVVYAGIAQIAGSTSKVVTVKVTK